MLSVRQVRVSYFPEGGGRPATKRLHLHDGRAHKLALQPEAGRRGAGGGPLPAPCCFYSSGEDGDVCLYDLRMSDAAPIACMAATAGGRWVSGAWVMQQSTMGHVAV